MVYIVNQHQQYYHDLISRKFPKSSFGLTFSTDLFRQILRGLIRQVNPSALDINETRFDHRNLINQKQGMDIQNSGQQPKREFGK
jgi:hypothetical protein